MENILKKFLNKPIYSRNEISLKSNILPDYNGLYLWFFKKVPDLINIEECYKINKFVLLYAGISPKNEKSKYNLRKRIRIDLFAI